MAFDWPLRVYWEDTDAGGIVFYANYLKFFERARTEWLRTLGIEQHALKQRTGGMFVVSETAIKYHRPARLDDRLLVTTTLAETGRVTLLLHQQAWRLPEENLANSNTLLCEGTIRIAWVQAASLKSARIPQNILETLK